MISCIYRDVFQSDTFRVETICSINDSGVLLCLPDFLGEKAVPIKDVYYRFMVEPEADRRAYFFWLNTQVLPKLYPYFSFSCKTEELTESVVFEQVVIRTLHIDGVIWYKAQDLAKLVKVPHLAYRGEQMLHRAEGDKHVCTYLPLATVVGCLPLFRDDKSKLTLLRFLSHKHLQQVLISSEMLELYHLLCVDYNLARFDAWWKVVEAMHV